MPRAKFQLLTAACEAPNTLDHSHLRLHLPPLPLDHCAPVSLCSREHLHSGTSLFLKTPVPFPHQRTTTPCASSITCLMQYLSSQEDGTRAISTLCISEQCLANSTCSTKTQVKRSAGSQLCRILLMSGGRLSQTVQGPHSECYFQIR